MTIDVAERRIHVRLAVSHPVTLWDRRGRLLVRGRTGDVCESGLLVLVAREQERRVPEWIVVEMAVPDISFSGRGKSTRRVRFSARVVHRNAVGEKVGLGVELIGKAE
jgi:hypothetical protein